MQHRTFLYAACWVLKSTRNYFSILFKDLNKAHSCFLPTEKDETENVLTDDFQIHFFELPKMKIGDTFVMDDRLKKWAFFFNNEGLLNEEEVQEI
ncbi:MAG: PD-(D/E)XK nuclease family transposase [Spirochaetaceae bacterium]|nr:PD-(D/E)XK nuclease family transposase [Spirochaetaceae bacterium]